MPAGRPKGAKGKYPNHSKIRDELLKHNFDWTKEFAKTFQEAPIDIRRDMLLGIAPYLFPRRKPEDGSGDAGPDTIVVPVAVSDDQLLNLCKQARGEE